MTGLDQREWVVQVLGTQNIVEREVVLGEGAFEIGRRAEGVACPDDDQMADRQARIARSESGITLEDLGTGSGVWLRVRGTDGRVLENDDQVWVGAQILVIRRKRGDAGEIWQVRHHGPDGRLRATHDVPADGLLIGRASDLVLDAGDGQLSRRHAQIAFIKGELRFFDRGAHNGSYLRLRRPEPIGEGAEFRVASRQFRVEERIPELGNAQGARVDPLEEATLLIASQDSSPTREKTEASGLAPHESPQEEKPTADGTQRPRGLGARLRRLGRRGRVSESGSSARTEKQGAPETPVAARAVDRPVREAPSGPVLLVIDSASGSVSLEVEAGKTVLEAVQEAGLERGEPVDWECEDGGCGVCVVGVVEGADRLDPPDPATGEMKTIQITEQVAPDPTKYRLACLARVRGTVRLRKLTE